MTNEIQVLARGKGISKMLQVCFDRKLSDKNSTLKIKNPDDLESSWMIYSK